jgi:Cu/Ag efflux protein CusF
VKHFVAVSVIAFGLFLGSGSPSDAQGAMTTAEIQEKAVVESVDMSTRHVLLRGDDGKLETVTVGPEARNLGQVKPGDQVEFTIRLGVAAQMAPSDGSGAPIAHLDVASRAQPGEKPGGFVGQAVRVRVIFVAYNPKTKTVSFTLPSGEQRSRTLQTKDMQDFASGLKAGDKVDVTFARSLAIAVRPAK